MNQFGAANSMMYTGSAVQAVQEALGGSRSGGETVREQELSLMMGQLARVVARMQQELDPKANQLYAVWQQLQAVRGEVQAMTAATASIEESVAQPSSRPSEADSAGDSATQHSPQLRQAASSTAGDMDAPLQQSSRPLARDSAELSQLRSLVSSLEQHNARLEATRNDLSSKQGELKAEIARLEGRAASSDKTVKRQMTEMNLLKVHNEELQRQVVEMQAAMGVTPERCRATHKQLQEESQEAQVFARTNEARVQKLKEIVQQEVQEITELRDFAQMERRMLLEKEQQLEAQLQQQRATAEQLAAQLHAAQGQLQQTQEQLLRSTQELYHVKESNIELSLKVQEQQELLARAREAVAEASQQREEAAQKLRGADAQLQDVVQYSRKLFKQVRGIMHTLERHQSHWRDVPEMAPMVRSLQTWLSNTNKSLGIDLDRPAAASDVVAGGAVGQPQQQQQQQQHR